MNTSPIEGGCWFCHDDEGELYFTCEWDSWFHMDCMKKELAAHNPEAEIIANEYNIQFVPQEEPQEETL